MIWKPKCSSCGPKRAEFVLLHTKKKIYKYGYELYAPLVWVTGNKRGQFFHGLNKLINGTRFFQHILPQIYSELSLVNFVRFVSSTEFDKLLPGFVVKRTFRQGLNCFQSYKCFKILESFFCSFVSLTRGIVCTKIVQRYSHTVKLHVRHKHLEVFIPYQAVIAVTPNIARGDASNQSQYLNFSADDSSLLHIL